MSLQASTFTNFTLCIDDNNYCPGNSHQYNCHKLHYTKGDENLWKAQDPQHQGPSTYPDNPAEINNVLDDVRYIFGQCYDEISSWVSQNTQNTPPKTPWGKLWGELVSLFPSQQSTTTNSSATNNIIESSAKKNFVEALLPPNIRNSPNPTPIQALLSPNIPTSSNPTRIEQESTPFEIASLGSNLYLSFKVYEPNFVLIHEDICAAVNKDIWLGTTNVWRPFFQKISSKNSKSSQLNSQSSQLNPNLALYTKLMKRRYAKIPKKPHTLVIKLGLSFLDKREHNDQMTLLLNVQKLFEDQYWKMIDTLEKRAEKSTELDQQKQYHTCKYHLVRDRILGFMYRVFMAVTVGITDVEQYSKNVAANVANQENPEDEINTLPIDNPVHLTLFGLLQGKMEFNYHNYYRPSHSIIILSSDRTKVLMIKSFNSMKDKSPVSYSHFPYEIYQTTKEMEYTDTNIPQVAIDTKTLTIDHYCLKFPGGKVEDSDINGFFTARREFCEETGINLDPFIQNGGLIPADQFSLPTRNKIYAFYSLVCANTDVEQLLANSIKLPVNVENCHEAAYCSNPYWTEVVDIGWYKLPQALLNVNGRAINTSYCVTNIIANAFNKIISSQYLDAQSSGETDLTFANFTPIKPLIEPLGNENPPQLLPQQALCSISMEPNKKKDKEAPEAETLAPEPETLAPEAENFETKS